MTRAARRRTAGPAVPAAGASTVRVVVDEAAVAAALALLKASVLGEDVVLPAVYTPGLTAGLLTIAAELLGRLHADPASGGLDAAVRWLDWRASQEQGGG